MKRSIILILALLMVACVAPLPASTPTSTPDEHGMLKAYLEQARALIDSDKEAIDALYYKVGLDKADTSTLEGRQAWQEYAIRYHPLLAELESQWDALQPPAMAESYHLQMKTVIEKKIERNMALETAPIALEDAFMEIVFGDLEELESELLLEAEAERKFDTLWQIATESED